MSRDSDAQEPESFRGATKAQFEHALVLAGLDDKVVRFDHLFREYYSSFWRLAVTLANRGVVAISDDMGEDPASVVEAWMLLSETFLNEAHARGRLIVVEGYSDWVALDPHVAGGQSCVLRPSQIHGKGSRDGIDGMKRAIPALKGLLSRGDLAVIFLVDGDEAGRRAERSITERCAHSRPWARVHRLSGIDTDSTLVTDDAFAFLPAGDSVEIEHLYPRAVHDKFFEEQPELCHTEGHKYCGPTRDPKRKGDAKVKLAELAAKSHSRCKALANLGQSLVKQLAELSRKTEPA